MKINAKLFILVFSIITFISILSAFIYHTLSQQLLQNQQSKNLVNSANDFIFTFQDLTLELDEEFQKFNNLSFNNIEDSKLDFVLSVAPDGSIEKDKSSLKNVSTIYLDVNNIQEFLKYNTNLIVRNSTSLNREYYYGIETNYDILQKLSEKIRAEIALVEQNVVTALSNNNENQYYLPILSKFSRELKNRNNFELVYSSFDEYDFSATHYTPLSSLNRNAEIDFIIFNISKEAAAFKDTMTLVTAVIVISGILLAIIFLLLFTSKFRSQIQYITNAVENIAAGDMSRKVEIITKDEIGKLGEAFNNMLEEIEKRDIIEKEYTDFISIINQNPSLDKLGNEALKRIVKTTGVDTGAFYLFEETNLKQFAVYGLSIEDQIDNYFGFYKKAAENKEILEIKFEDNQPVIRTGITELKVNFLYILPIFHNNQNIAVLELASVNSPEVDIKKYLLRIKDQLAIGLANGKSLSELKNLVSKLQNLNNAYQKQNIEIIEKNDELVKLHSELKKGAEELEKQTEKAVESEKIKSQFLANMSHELRTPQNSILGLTELILNDKTTSQKTKERLRVVLSNGKKLLNLIENILEYSKFESGNTEIKETGIYLSEFLEEVKSFVSPLFWEKDYNFIIKAPDDFDYKIFTDVKKLEQITYNFIGNASKFTRKGYVKLEVVAKQNDLVLIVEDTGIGITEEDKKIIFDEFRQVDASLNRKFSGTGLGLAICRRYCELLKANLNVESELGTGSKFTVILPNVIKEKRDRNENAKKNTASSKRFHTLLISDGSNSSELIKGYLNSNNIDVSISHSIDFSIESIAQHKPDLIILNILLKNKNGWRLLAELKSNKESSILPIVVINMDEEANCGLGLNIYDYHAKTITKKNILETVNEIEEKKGTKIHEVLFSINEKEFMLLKNNLQGTHFGNIKNCGAQGFWQFDKSEPDLIVIDLNEEENRPIKTISDLNNNIKIKSIPILGFIDQNSIENVSNTLNNEIIETTLLNGYHPLDVLKTIRDRINLIDDSVFSHDIENVEELKTLSPWTTNNESDPISSLKILVVDDDADTRFTIGEMIESLGFKPLFASNGYDCLKELDNDLPDLVLLDIMMPKMDGFQTVKKIRENKKYSNLNVLALTAYAMLSDKEIVEKNGFNGLITKPVNSAQLKRKFNQIFNLVN